MSLAGVSGLLSKILRVFDQRGDTAHERFRIGGKALIRVDVYRAPDARARIPGPERHDRDPLGVTPIEEADESGACADRDRAEIDHDGVGSPVQLIGDRDRVSDAPRDEQLELLAERWSDSIEHLLVRRHEEDAWPGHTTTVLSSGVGGSHSGDSCSRDDRTGG